MTSFSSSFCVFIVLDDENDVVDVLCVCLSDCFVTDVLSHVYREEPLTFDKSGIINIILQT